jgi:hypothetical protein
VRQRGLGRFTRRLALVVLRAGIGVHMQLRRAQERAAVIDAWLGGSAATAGGCGRLARGLLLLRDGNGRADVLTGGVGGARAYSDVPEQEDRVLGGILQLLEEGQRLLVVAQAALDAVICGRRAR